MKVNKARIENMTDKQLIEFLDFKKPVYQLEGYEYLIATLASRLHSVIDLLDDESGMYNKLQEAKQLQKETQKILQEVRTELNDMKMMQIQAH